MARRSTATSPPSPKMSGLKIIISFGLAIFFDFLKLVFSFFTFLLSFLVAPGIVGVLITMFIGFAGGIVMAIWFWIFCGLTPWNKSRSLLWVGLGWIASMIPFVNMFFPQTFATWGIVAGARKEDREERKKWEAENAARQAEEQQTRRQQIQQMRAAHAERAYAEQAQQEAETAEQAQAEQDQER